MVTTEQQATREYTLAAVLREAHHNQAIWLAESPEYLVANGIISREDLPVEKGQSVNVCGTVGCAAGHAVFSHVDTVKVTAVGTFGPGAIRHVMEYVVEEHVYSGEDDVLRAVADKIDPENDILWDHEDWAAVGGHLLGISNNTSEILFDGNHSHNQIVYSLQRLVAGEDITEQITWEEYARRYGTREYTPDRVSYYNVETDKYATDVDGYEEPVYERLILIAPPADWELPANHVAKKTVQR